MRAGVAPQPAGRRGGQVRGDKGPCDNSPTHIFNLTASVETPRFANDHRARARVGVATVGIFRATSGNVLSITTGIDRSLNGVITARSA